MADFSFLSDTDDESSSAVQEILAQAMDDCILNQISAINCSSFSHSVLPSHLESRFQRLKTFPLVPDSVTESKKSTRERGSKGKSNSLYVSSPSDSSISSSGDVDFPKLKVKSVDREVKEGKFPPGSLSFCSDSPISSAGHANSLKLKVKSGDGEVKEEKFSSGSFSFCSNESNSPKETMKSGCFWCSPKKVSRKKSVEKNEILGDLDLFSSKEQKKLMKKAMKEEEKINKEAEKIVKWAKQASERFDISDIDDGFSDDDDNGHNSRVH